MEYHFLLGTPRCNSHVPYCLPWNFSSSWRGCQSLSTRRGEPSHSFSDLSLFCCLTRCQREHAGLTEESVLHGLPLKESVDVWTPLSLSSQVSEQHTHSRHKHAIANTHSHVWMPHTRTHRAEVQTITRPRCDAPLLEWLCEAKVTRSHSFIPIIPRVSWARGLLMASTLWKGTTALTYTPETPAAHSPTTLRKEHSNAVYTIHQHG